MGRQTKLGKALVVSMIPVLALLCSTQMGQAAPRKLVREAHVVAVDGTFLGAWQSPIHAESIFNHSGPFGSSQGPDSIYNWRSPFGSPNDPRSPWNASATSPPALVGIDGEIIAYLTVNKALSPRIDPLKLFDPGEPWAALPVIGSLD